MTTHIVDNFADLGAALERLEKAKSQATADVPEPDAVAAVEQQLRVNQDWTSIYGIATAPIYFMGFSNHMVKTRLVEIDPSADYTIECKLPSR